MDMEVEDTDRLDNNTTKLIRILFIQYGRFQYFRKFFEKNLRKELKILLDYVR